MRLLAFLIILLIPFQILFANNSSQNIDLLILEEIGRMQNEWDHIQYKIDDTKLKIALLNKLEAQAETVFQQYPNRAEPKIWLGIIISTKAGIEKGIHSLSKVKLAKKLFEEAIAIEPNALDGSAFTSLGSLYYKVPSWPVSFGNNIKAKENLTKALQINPDGIDPNYFYGEYLSERGNAIQAKYYLNKALHAPMRHGRELADAGRRKEIQLSLSKLKLNNE